MPQSLGCFYVLTEYGDFWSEARLEVLNTPHRAPAAAPTPTHEASGPSDRKKRARPTRGEKNRAQRAKIEALEDSNKQRWSRLTATFRLPERVKDSGSISASPAALMSGRQSNAAQPWQESVGSYSSVRLGILGPGQELSGCPHLLRLACRAPQQMLGFSIFFRSSVRASRTPLISNTFVRSVRVSSFGGASLEKRQLRVGVFSTACRKDQHIDTASMDVCLVLKTKRHFSCSANCPSWLALRWTCCKFQLHHEHSGKGGSKSAPQASIDMMVHLVCVTLYKKGTALSMLHRWRQTRSSSNITWSTSHLTPAQLASTCAPASSSAVASRTFPGVPRLASKRKRPGGGRGSCSTVIPTKGVGATSTIAQKRASYSHIIW